MRVAAVVCGAAWPSTLPICIRWRRRAPARLARLCLRSWMRTSGRPMIALMRSQARGGVIVGQADAQQLLRDGERLGLQRDDMQLLLLGVRRRLDQSLRAASIWSGCELQHLADPAAGQQRQPQRQRGARLLSASSAAWAAAISVGVEKDLARAFGPLAHALARIVLDLAVVLEPCQERATSIASARLARPGCAAPSRRASARCGCG